MSNNDYYKMDEHPPLRKFAYIGRREDFLKRMRYLASFAEEENWEYDDPNNTDPLSQKYGVLYQYIMHTFTKALEDGLIEITDTHAIFNTGLFSRRDQQEIYMLFEKNKFNPESKVQYLPEWYFSNFYISPAHEIPQNLRSKLPDYVDYFKDCPEHMFFDPKLHVEISMKHILENMDRLPQQLQQMGEEFVTQFINVGWVTMKKRIQRNNRLVVPQYFNKKIMYLAPLKFLDGYIPLAIERHESSYRINTAFTPGMAYCNARLLMKPESNWLTNHNQAKNLIKTIA